MKTRLLAAVLAIASPARAEELPLTYDAPPECPTRAAFVDEVRARAPVAANALPDQSFTVTIRREDAWLGQLVIGAGDTSATRLVRGATCREAIRALALALATALEPADPSEAQGPASTAQLRAPEEAASPVAPSAPADTPPAATAEPARRTAPSVAAALGASLGATGGVAPSVAPELAAFGDLAWGARSVRAALALALGPAIPTADGHAVLRRALVRVEGCPLATDLGSFRPSLCAALEGGPVFASGADFQGAETRVRPWVAVALVGRIRTPLAGLAFAELDARMTVPFVRDRYFFRPDTTIYEVGAVTASAAASVGVRFP